jgi:hypothetical protein
MAFATGSPPEKSPELFAPTLARDPLERETELALVERLLADAEGGRGAFLLIEGPAGIGKTDLLASARKRGEARGMEVLHARAGELSTRFEGFPWK